MEETPEGERVMTGRFYTSARRFKQVLGSLPDGTKIPGGPYTYSQIGVMLGALVVGWMTRGVWGSGSAIGDLIIVLVIAVGAGVIIAKLPSSRRNPLRLTGSLFVLLFHPGAGGRWKGRPLRLTIHAKKIQRDQKNAAKAAARAEKRATAPSGAPSPTDEVIPALTTPAGYGSSLNRLLAEHGLLDDERKS